MYITVFILTILLPGTGGAPYPSTTQHLDHTSCIRAGQMQNTYYQSQTGKSLSWSCRPQQVYVQR